MADGFITRRGGGGAIEITGQHVFTGTAAETIAQFDTISVDEVNKHINKLDDPATLPTGSARQGVSFSRPLLRLGAGDYAAMGPTARPERSARPSA